VKNSRVVTGEQLKDIFTVQFKDGVAGGESVHTRPETSKHVTTQQMHTVLSRTSK